MARINYFDDGDEAYSHPKLTKWQRMRSQPSVADWRIELRRKKQGLAHMPARLFIHFFDAARNEVDQDDEPWDPDLNKELVRMCIKAINEENESSRYAYAFQHQFQPV